MNYNFALSEDVCDLHAGYLLTILKSSLKNKTRILGC